MKYPKNIDKECILLCDAMNKISGIMTLESCCGHKKTNFRIWFSVTNLDNLPQLLYWFDGCHCGFYGWRVLVSTDCGMSPVKFKVEGPKGGYEEANKIAELIIEDVEHGDNNNA